MPEALEQIQEARLRCFRPIASLVTKVRETIDFPKEFRTTLISAAVTDKIDVREEPA